VIRLDSLGASTRTRMYLGILCHTATLKDYRRTCVGMQGYRLGARLHHRLPDLMGVPKVMVVAMPGLIVLFPTAWPAATFCLLADDTTNVTELWGLTGSNVMLS
jgi:hypothetical protein